MKTLTRLALAAALVAVGAAACSDATGPKFPSDGEDIDTSNPKNGGGGAFVAPSTAPTVFYA